MTDRTWTWSEDVDWGGAPAPAAATAKPPHPFVTTTRRLEANDGSRDAAVASQARRNLAEGGPRAVYGSLLPGGDSDDEDRDMPPPPLLDDEDENGQLAPPAPGEELLMLPAIPDDENEDEREFMAIKPWLGAMYPPSEYIRDPKNPHNVFDAEYNNWAAPEVKLDLDYIFGYRGRDSRDNVHWLDETHIVFPAAAVGVVLDLVTTDEYFYFGHDDDIVCMDYHKGTNMVASGSIGARNTVRLNLWSPQFTKDGQKTVHCIMGFHQFAVLSVAFNPQGTIVASVGMDEHHSVALFCTRTGAMLANAPADKNRLLHCRFNRASTVCNATHFVTVGVRHISFWTPKDTSLPFDKTGDNNYFFKTSAELDQRLDFQRGYGCEELDREGFCFYSIDFSPTHAVVGASNGCLYLFNAKTWGLDLKFENSTYRILSVQTLDDARTTFAVGCGEGFIRFVNVGGTATAPQITPAKSVLPLGDTAIDMNVLDNATNNDSPSLVNSIRAMCYDPSTKKLLVGTLLHHIYSVDLTKSTLAKPLAKVCLAAHWPNLNDEELGELWAIDTVPGKQWVVTASDDCTVRIWDLDQAVEVARRYTHGRGYKVSCSLDGSMIAVCHRNGTFVVFSGDLKERVWPMTRFSNSSGCDIQFSPSGEYLAIAGDKHITVYQISTVVDAVTGAKRKHFRRMKPLRGHTSHIDSFDWNISSTLIKSASKGYDLLAHSIPSCARVASAKSIADEVWFTETCIIGWGVQGIWPRFADGSDINSTGLSRSHKWLCVTDDWGKVKIFNYPCVGSGLDRKTGQLRVRPDCHTYVGHCSHVTNCTWTYDDTYVCTTGGADLCMFSWKVNYGPGGALKPTRFFNTAMVDGIKQHVADARAADAARKAAGLPEEPDLPSYVLPSDCFMCHFLYPDAFVNQCPRCFAPRRKPVAVVQAAWNGKLSRARVPVKARFKHPTNSFANYTMQQQAQRKKIDETVKDGVWYPGASTHRNVKIGIELSDSDEESCKQSVMSAASTAKKAPKPVPKKGKKTNGPDFADL